MIGRNQADFGELTEDDISTLPYADELKSFLYVTKLSFGEINTDPFFLGANKLY